MFPDVPSARFSFSLPLWGSGGNRLVATGGVGAVRNDFLPKGRVFDTLVAEWYVFLTLRGRLSG